MSNAAEGFDPNWDEEKRVEYYRKKIEEKFGGRIRKEKEYDEKIEAKEFITFANFVREAGYPLLLNEVGVMEVELPGSMITEELIQSALDLGIRLFRLEE